MCPFGNLYGPYRSTPCASVAYRKACALSVFFFFNELIEVTLVNKIIQSQVYSSIMHHLHCMSCFELLISLQEIFPGTGVGVISCESQRKYCFKSFHRT